MRGERKTLAHGAGPSALVACLLLLASCGRTPGEKAREAYLAGNFESAIEIFRTMSAADSTDVQALHGLARSAETLHLYDEAVSAYEEAVRLEPENGQIRQEYVETLSAGGTLKGRRDWMERAVEAGHQALLVAPDRPLIYDHLLNALQQIGQMDRYQRILENVASRYPASPVLETKRLEFELSSAAASGDQEATAAVRGEIREALARSGGAGAGRRGGHGLSVPEHYRRAVFHQLLGERDSLLVEADRLAELPGGEPLARTLLWWDRMVHDYAEAMRNEDPESVLQFVRRWRSRFRPTWESGIGEERVLAELEFEALAQQAEDRKAEAGDQEARLPRSMERRIRRAGEHWVRMDTWGRAEAQVRVASTLSRLGARPATAMDVIERGLRMVREQPPGTFYPGDTPRERRDNARHSEAQLRIYRARALAERRKRADALADVEKAIELEDRAEYHAELARLKEEAGDQQGAYEAYMAALARMPVDMRSEEITSLQMGAERTASRLGLSAGRISSDLTESRASWNRLRVERMVEDQLDEPAPDFELGDMDGRRWRLSDLRGRVVVLNFWATWCGPCREELPFFQEIGVEYAGDDRVLFCAIATDADPRVVAPWLEEQGLDLNVLYDNGAALDYNITGIPTTVIVGPQGRVRYREVGFAGAEIYRELMRLRIGTLLED